jgi:hypothetical protein
MGLISPDVFIYKADDFEVPMETFSEWQEWFAWRPVKVNDDIVWMKLILRRSKQSIWPRNFFDKKPKVNQKWEYGNLFDVLKNE